MADDHDTNQDDHAGPGPVAAARRAVSEISDLLGRRPEAVVSIQRRDDGWEVGVEVVETHRIPDTADILAIYEVRLGADGDLHSYRRTRRYARGQLDRECER
jgi:Gas vesicle synthesis protein GvpO